MIRRYHASTLFPYTTLFRSLLIWYSLAKDAKKRGLSREVIFTYLSEALNIMEQLREVDKFSFLPQMKNAIDGILDELGASNLRSEEHTSELQSLAYLVCRLL